MASSYRPNGLFVPLVTPFAGDGSVDLVALEALAVDALDAGATDVVALATTGEPTSLDDAERDAVVSVCASVCGDRGGELLVGRNERHTHDDCSP